MMTFGLVLLFIYFAAAYRVWARENILKNGTTKSKKAVK
jgi:hypothetical protein